MSAGRRTQRSVRSDWDDAGRAFRHHADARVAADAIVEAIEPSDDYGSGPVPEPEDDAVAVGGEEAWRWCEWTWFGADGAEGEAR